MGYSATPLTPPLKGRESVRIIYQEREILFFEHEFQESHEWTFDKQRVMNQELEYFFSNTNYTNLTNYNRTQILTIYGIFLWNRKMIYSCY